MTHRVRGVFGRLAALGGAAVVVVALGASALAAQQTTGKIEGTVADQAGVPIAGAQVLLVGTSFGAITNAQGYYFINNVPVGTYTLRAQFIGYAPTELRGLRVLGGQTLTADVRMQSSAVVLGGVTIEAAANPIVPRDQVATKTIVTGELVDRLPVDDVRNVINLTPGVVESGSALGVSIRGGRPGEANVYIDGAPVRASNSGGQRVSLGTNAVEEASVTTGALGVEFSDAQSGVVSFTTRAGHERLEGSLSYESDEPFGNSLGHGFNRFEGNIGGPVPGVENLRFFFSAVARGARSDFAPIFGGEPVPGPRGLDNVASFIADGVDTTVAGVEVPRFVQATGECGKFGSDANPLAQSIKNNYGVECEGQIFPMNWSSQQQLQGNLQYTYGTGSSVRLTGIASGTQGRGWPGTAVANAALFGGRHDWSRLAVLNWFHQVSKTTEQALSLNLNLSWQRDNQISGPLDPDYELDSREKALGMEFGTMKFNFPFPFPIDEDIIRNIRTNTGLRVPLLDRNDLRNAQPHRVNPYGMAGGGWFTQGFDVGGTLYRETRYTGRFIVDWQANRYHRFTLGADASKTNLRFWSSGFLRQSFMDAYVVDPVKFGVFAADRLDLGDVVLEGGLRYDYFDANALFPKVPGRIFSHPAWDNNDYEGSLAAVFDESKSHTTLSPRVRVSFPVTENTGFRLSYSHQVQTPDFNTLASGINNDLSFTNTNDAFGRDVTFGKTILFEFGIRHAFSQDMVLDISAYNKDKVSDLAYRILPFEDPLNPGDTLLVNVLTNADFGNIRGVDIKLDRRVGNYLNASVAYTFQVAKSTGSDPFSYLRTTSRQISQVTQSRVPPPQAILPTDDNRTHNLNATVALSLPSDWRQGTTLGRILRDVDAFLTARVQSGLPYTRLNVAGTPTLAVRTAFGLISTQAEPINSSRLPWTKNIDLRVNKGFRVRNADVTLFADVRNLFNFRNVQNVFAETGDVVNPAHRATILDPQESSELTALRNEAAANNALLPGNAITLGNCAGWIDPVNCVMLQRTEARFGDGDGVYSQAEQQRALGAYYDLFFSPQGLGMYGPGRRMRIGLELSF
ncbi:MAG TPA: TonB-dependent receptor [Gemmatimonadales bacterium]|nr:TonB-dependent receptor [Gemmatimonadales bacterium]